MNELPFSRESDSRMQLGPLERQLFEQVWSRGGATVRDLLADGKIHLAYTTVMTTLDRLFKKGLLDRTAEGKAFRYSTRCTPAELPGLVAARGFRHWIDSTGVSSLPLSYIVEVIGTHDARLLDELRELIEQKRRELKKGESL